MTETSENLSRTIADIHGVAGIQWLERLPLTIDDCASRWSLSLLPPFDALSYHYVMPAISKRHGDVVLKLGVACTDLTLEIEALRLLDGRGAARLLDADPEVGCLLLERLESGAPLSDLADDEFATARAAELMVDLWRPIPDDNPFPSVCQWSAGLARLRDHFGGGTGPFPDRLVEAAEHHFQHLQADAAGAVVLHGDLHHGNILSAGRRPWLAIDPKGVIGEPVYETGALMRNPYPALLDEPRPARILSRRADQLAEQLGFDRQRIVAWALAQAVLAGWWQFEDHGHGFEWWITCADAMARIE